MAGDEIGLEGGDLRGESAPETSEAHGEGGSRGSEGVGDPTAEAEGFLVSRDQRLGIVPGLALGEDRLGQVAGQSADFLSEPTHAQV